MSVDGRRLGARNASVQTRAQPLARQIRALLETLAREQLRELDGLLPYLRSRARGQAAVRVSKASASERRLADLIRSFGMRQYADAANEAAGTTVLSGKTVDDTIAGRRVRLGAISEWLEHVDQSSRDAVRTFESDIARIIRDTVLAGERGLSDEVTRFALFDQLGFEMESKGERLGAPRQLVLVDLEQLIETLDREDPGALSQTGEIDGRVDGALAFFEHARAEGLKVEAPSVGISTGGKISVGDGRHRLEALRRLGVKEVPIGVERNELTEIADRIGLIVRRPTTTELARDIRRAVSENVDISFERAFRIARTETAIAQNTGAVTGYQLAGVERIRWLAYQSPIWPRRHDLMDGEEIGIGGLFKLPSGARMRWPHDPSGPVSEIVNCRCGVAPVRTRRAA